MQCYLCVLSWNCSCVNSLFVGCKKNKSGRGILPRGIPYFTPGVPDAQVLAKHSNNLQINSFFRSSGRYLVVMLHRGLTKDRSIVWIHWSGWSKVWIWHDDTSQSSLFMSGLETTPNRPDSSQHNCQQVPLNPALQCSFQSLSYCSSRCLNHANLLFVCFTSEIPLQMSPVSFQMENREQGEKGSPALDTVVDIKGVAEDPPSE